MTSIASQVYVSLGFLAVNVLALCMVLILNRRGQSKPTSPQASAELLPSTPEPRSLDAKDILGWEFDYAKTTASQAMQDRHTMINYYLLAVGITASGLVGVLGKNLSLPTSSGTLFLWLLCGIGWLYFLKLIRLRQAWHGSMCAMNQIKEFYIQHSDKFSPEVLRAAFRWQSDSLPSPDQPWTVFFYSGMLIALLDSVAYAAGAALLCLDCTLAQPGSIGLQLGMVGLIFFAFHVWLFFAFLKPVTPSGATPSTQREEN
jgi:hypothetical protein